MNVTNLAKKAANSNLGLREKFTLELKKQSVKRMQNLELTNIETISQLGTGNNWLHRGTSEIFPNRLDSNNPQESLERLLETTQRPLRIKLGIDPTGADIHLGHSIPVRKLRAFQDAGHTAVLIIGDFTARIGDPTGKSEVRRQLTEEMVAQMKPGSVIVDLAAEQGGNCARTEPGKDVQWHGVTIIGTINLPSSMPIHASQMYSKNLATLVQYLVKDNVINLDFADDIIDSACITHGGEIRNQRVRDALTATSATVGN